MSTFRVIQDELVPEFVEHARRKAADYGEGHQALGIRGQFSDMNRKWTKLKRFMWDEPESQPTNESLEEILFDMIGHCFLTIALLRDDSRTHPLRDREALRKILDEVMLHPNQALGQCIVEILKGVGMGPAVDVKL